MTRYTLLALSILSIACAPNEIERTITTSSPIQNCYAIACLPRVICGPIEAGKQFCEEGPAPDCNPCVEPTETRTECVPLNNEPVHLHFEDAGHQ